MGDLWVFGYGSLMWRPGFDFIEMTGARMNGVHRSPCIYSWVHRGTRERPGIVLGLDRGGSCRGLAFRVANHLREDVVGYLRERELVTNVYLETERRAVLDDGRQIRALTYVVDRNHPQYAGRLSPADLFDTISGAAGNSGPNEEYIISTARHLRKLGIHDALIDSLAQEIEARGA